IDCSAPGGGSGEGRAGVAMFSEGRNLPPAPIRSTGGTRRTQPETRRLLFPQLRGQRIVTYVFDDLLAGIAAHPAKEGANLAHVQRGVDVDVEVTPDWISAAHHILFGGVDGRAGRILLNGQVLG